MPDHLIARGAILFQLGLACFAQTRWIQNGPIFHFEMVEPGQFQCAALGCRAQSDNQIEGTEVIPPIFHFIEAAGFVARQLNAHFLTNCDGKSIDFHIVFDTDRLHISARTIELFHDTFCHR